MWYANVDCSSFRVYIDKNFAKESHMLIKMHNDNNDTKIPHRNKCSAQNTSKAL